MAPAVWYVSLNTGWLTLLSFTFSAFLAISYATFFSKPQIFLLIYVGIIVGEIPRTLVLEGLGIGLSGDLFSSLMLIAVAIYLIWWSRELQSGNVPN